MTALQLSDYRGAVSSCDPEDQAALQQFDAASVVITDFEQGMAIRRRRLPASGSRGEQPHVMVVSNRAGEHEVRSAIESGIKGYLLTACALDELVLGVRQVHQGLRHFCDAAASRMVDSMSRDPLTHRELDVLRCMVEGHVNKRICDELDIALGTVKAHIKSIFSKLGVATRTQAVAFVKTRGLIAASPQDGRPRRHRQGRPAGD